MKVKVLFFTTIVLLLSYLVLPPVRQSSTLPSTIQQEVHVGAPLPGLNVEAPPDEVPPTHLGRAPATATANDPQTPKTKGEANQLAVCIDFSDVKGSTPISTINEEFNGSFEHDPSSVNGYYWKVSRGQLNQLWDACSSGWITLSNPKSYYFSSDSPYGTNCWSWPHCINNAVGEALQILVDSGFDFAKFNNGNGFGTIAAIIAGDEGSYTGRTGNVWAHFASSINFPMPNGLLLRYYWAVGEWSQRSQGIPGVLGPKVHEMVHTWFQWDLYPPFGNMDLFSVMGAGGEWGGKVVNGFWRQGMSPASPDANTRISIDPDWAKVVANVDVASSQTITQSISVLLRPYSTGPVEDQGEMAIINGSQGDRFYWIYESDPIVATGLLGTRRDLNSTGNGWPGSDPLQKVCNEQGGHYTNDVIDPTGNQYLQRGIGGHDNEIVMPGSRNIRGIWANGGMPPTTASYRDCSPIVAVTSVGNPRDTISFRLITGPYEPPLAYFYFPTIGKH